MYYQPILGMLGNKMSKEFITAKELDNVTPDSVKSAQKELDALESSARVQKWVRFTIAAGLVAVMFYCLA